MAHDTPDANTCAYNDLALVKIDPADRDKVSPTVPVFGGPTGIRTAGVPAGSTVYSYQNSSLRQGIGLLSPKQGLNLGDSGGGWTHEVATITPGVPGDSGSGFMDAAGNAFGVLSTLNLEPAPGTNGVGDLNRELAYANAHGMGDVVLQCGGPFHPPLPLPSLAGTPRADAASSDSDGETASAEEPEQSVTNDAPSANTPDRGLSITPKRSEPGLPSQGAPEKQPGLVGGL